jgi:tetratricopeptide (TPR) repeat protein
MVEVICRGQPGVNAAVAEALDTLVLKRSGVSLKEDENSAAVDMINLEAAILVGHHSAAELLLGRLKNSGYRTGGMYRLTCLARHLGGAATLLERYDEARKHYQDAIRVTTEMRFRPELALTRLQMAELLLDHCPDERAEALEHLDFAIKEFREMKMQPSLERALRQKKILKA